MPANPFQDGAILSFRDLGDEVQVNVETNSNQQNAAVSVLSNGNFVVSWESNLQDGSGLGVYARLYSETGVALTGELPMNVDTSSDQRSPQVVALDNGRAMVVWTSGGDIWYRLIEADGTSPAGEFQINDTVSALNFEITPFASDNFMVTWEASDGVGTSSGVFGQRFSFNGTEAFSEIQINDESLGAQRRSDTAELLSGTVFTVFQSQGQTANASDQGIYLRNYSNTSTLAGSDILVSDDLGVFETYPQIEALDGGGFVVGWVNNTTGEIWAQSFLNTGAAIVSSLTNVSGAVGTNTLAAPVMTALPGDRYVIVWENDSTFSRDLHYHVLEADGTSVSTGLLHTNTSGTQSQAQVHVLPQGGFVTVFTSGSGTALDVFMVRHAEDGVPVGPPMQLEYPVNTTTSNQQATPDVAITDTGEIIVTWHSNAQDGSGFGVYLQRFSSPEIGTTGADVMNGDGDANDLAGWSGDDTINGLGGSDRFDGGLGRDQLNGGDGDDTLRGGAGNDILDGGSGTDLADYSGAGGDVEVYLNAGRSRGADGFDRLFNLENLQGSDFNDRLIGNGSDNSFWGGLGNDIIKGKGGTDTYFGEAGDDTMRGDAGVDTMHGGTGGDILLGLAGNDVLNGDDGQDFIYGGRDADMIFGGADDDTLRGNVGGDTISGGDGADDLRGGGNGDVLMGDADDDFLLGEGGTDTLSGGAGNDTMFGGFGSGNFDGLRDTFVFASAANGAGGFDRIRDFEDGIDQIDLTSFGFAAFADVDALAVDTGASMRINFGGGDVIYIDNFSTAQFTADDVLL